MSQHLDALPSRSELSALNSNKTDFFDAGNITATSESNAVALAIKAAFNAEFINATRKTAVVSFFYNTPWSVNVIDNYGSNHTFYFTAYTFNKVVQGYLGANDTACARFEELALNSKFTLHQVTVSGLSIQEFKSDVINLILVTGTASAAIPQWYALTNISGRKPVINTSAFYGGNFQVQADNGNLVANAAIASGAFIRSLIVY